VALSPTLYFNTDSDFDATMPESYDPKVKSFSSGITYIHPQKLTANFDISLAYTHYITQIGKHKLGVKAFASYPLLTALSTYTTYNYDLEHTSLGKIGKSTLITDNYAPLTFGFGIVLR